MAMDMATSFLLQWELYFFEYSKGLWGLSTAGGRAQKSPAERLLCRAGWVLGGGVPGDQFFSDCMGAGRRPPRLMNTSGLRVFSGMMGP